LDRTADVLDPEPGENFPLFLPFQQTRPVLVVHIFLTN